jgi:hypothetical protein
MWPEVVDRFGWNDRRQQLLLGLRAALEALRRAGCTTVYLDGSFVTAKELPADFDACWVMDGVDFRLLDPVLFDFAFERRAQKRKYGGELFPANFPATAFETSFLEYFQVDRDGRPKGIIVLDLETFA